MKYLVPTPSELTHISETSCRFVIRDYLGIWGVFGASPWHRPGPCVDSVDLRIPLSCCDSFLFSCEVRALQELIVNQTDHFGFHLTKGL